MVQCNLLLQYKQIQLKKRAEKTQIQILWSTNA